MGLKEIGYEVVECIRVAEGKFQY